MTDRGDYRLDDRVRELRIVVVAVELGHRHGRPLQRFREHRAQRRIVQMPLGVVVVREALQGHEVGDWPLGAGDQATDVLRQLLQFASLGAHRGYYKGRRE